MEDETERKKIIFEKKDKRMGWMNTFTGSVNLITASIDAGVFKPKNNDEIITETTRIHNIFYNDFLNFDRETIGASTGFSPKTQQTTPTQESLNPQIANKCSTCNVDIDNRVRDFSVKKYGRPLCRKCQT